MPAGRRLGGFGGLGTGAAVSCRAGARLRDGRTRESAACTAGVLAAIGAGSFTGSACVTGLLVGAFVEAALCRGAAGGAAGVVSSSGADGGVASGVVTTTAGVVLVVVVSVGVGAGMGMSAGVVVVVVGTTTAVQPAYSVVAEVMGVLKANGVVSAASENQPLKVVAAGRWGGRLRGRGVVADALGRDGSPWPPMSKLTGKVSSVHLAKVVASAGIVAAKSNGLASAELANHPAKLECASVGGAGAVGVEPAGTNRAVSALPPWLSKLSTWPNFSWNTLSVEVSV